jgi:SAM-dependent methyltransferase
MIDTTTPIYDTYAPIYDMIGQDRFGAHMARWTLQWLAARRSPVERVLDLACGTGVAALVFATAGQQVVGIDRSAAMLAIARGKARDAGHDISFIQGDIRALGTKDQRPTTNDDLAVSVSPCLRVSVSAAAFDLATCFYDSLNYLTEDGDMARVFSGVARVLRPAGWLIFDLNMEAEYATWDERDVVTHDSPDCMVYNRLEYDVRARCATGRIVWFVREIDRWWRGEETHTERSWRDAEICAALAESGLTLTARLTLLGDPVVGDADAVPRMIYVAQRAAGT